MRNQDFFKNKKVAIVGLARSGASCANLLFDLGARVKITDNQDNADTRAFASRLKSPLIKYELGGHTREFIQGSDLAVISPGVSDTALPLVWAKQERIPVVSEIEVAWVLCPAPVIAVTGSAGKTTVASLTGKILQAAGKRAFVCGNIGNPFCGEVAEIKADDFVVLEVSSFQLEAIDKFKPKISVMLNLSRNHLDRYSGMDEYLAAKKRIFMNQDENDYLVLNQDDPAIKGLASQAKPRVFYFSGDSRLNPNQSAVAAIGRILGLDEKIFPKVFAEFKGIEHRMEEVAVIQGVGFVNDSKATTSQSCAWALGRLKGKVVLIAGGKDKGVDYGVIIEPAKDKVKKLILIGQARDKIKAALGNDLAIEEAATLEQAVNAAFSQASPGDTVLLSPMCASFDMFKDYEERGRVFKQIVNGLSRKQAVSNNKP